MSNVIQPNENSRGHKVCSKQCPSYVPNNDSTGDCASFGGCVVFWGQDACMPWYWQEIERLQDENKNLRMWLERVSDELNDPTLQYWCEWPSRDMELLESLRDDIDSFLESI